MSSIIEALLRDARSVAISGHVRPDGDCVGSCLGLYNYLKVLHPELRVRVYLGDYSESFSFLRGEELVRHEAEEETADLFFSLDASNPERLDCFEAMFHAAARRVVIDHHVTNPGFGEENIIDPDASSTCELLFSLMDPAKIDRETAECLYLGIIHDTGVFKHSNTRRKTLEVAGALLEKGVSPQKIIDETFYKKTYTQNKALGLALNGAELLLEGKMIVSALTRAQYKPLDLMPKDLDGIIDQLRVTDGVEVAAFLYELEPGQFKVSMRSREHVNVAEIARRYGGGGHERAAGFDMKEDWRKVAELIAAAVKEQL